MSGAREVRWPLFVLIVAVGLAAGLGAAYGQSRREPTLYRAQTSLVIERGGQPVAGASTSRLVSTFDRLIKSHVVAADVIKSLGLSESTSTLLHRISVAKSGNSAVLEVRVEGGDPALATKIVTQVAASFADRVRAQFGQSTTANQPIQVGVFDSAHPLAGQASPHVRRDLAWGGLLGLLVGLLVASLGARRPPEQLAVGLPVLGDAGSPDAVAEIVTQLAAQRPFQTVALAGDPDGVVTASLAHALAERGALTIWVRATDADDAELERLAARCAYVLVAGAAFDPRLSVDAAIAVTSPANVGMADSLLRQPGLRVLGTIASDGAEE